MQKQRRSGDILNCTLNTEFYFIGKTLKSKFKAFKVGSVREHTIYYKSSKKSPQYTQIEFIEDLKAAFSEIGNFYGK